MRPSLTALVAFSSLGVLACANGRTGDQDSGLRDARAADVRFGDLDTPRSDTWIGTFDAPGLDASIDAYVLTADLTSYAPTNFSS